nr:reverse transcriptase domain-containing protein [Tanacetum cinerariifolium]
MGRNMEVNTDDMVIMCDSEDKMMADINETLERLRPINLKLNPKKCSFRVEEGVYSGHLITKQGIRADPSKVKAVSTLQPPKMANDLQNLNKKITALSRVITNDGHTNKGRNSNNVLATSEEIMSAVLMAKGGKKQIPVYFVNRTLHGAELKYPKLEKLILVLVYAARKLQRNSIKGKIVADFLAETPLPLNKEAKNKEVKRKEPELENAWKLFTDKTSSSDGLGAGLMVRTKQESRHPQQTSINDLFQTRKRSSSRSHTRQVNREKGSCGYSPRRRNNWMTPIQEYLKSETLPNDPQKERKLRIKAPLYKMIKEKMYRRSYFSPWLRCVEPVQAKNIIKVVHEGSCGMHSGPRSVVSKITRLGYYWPSMHKDAKELIQKCEASQIYSSVPRKSKQEMTSIMSAWPFSQLGIDIVGPLPTTPGSARFLVVTIDYITK